MRNGKILAGFVFLFFGCAPLPKEAPMVSTQGPVVGEKGVKFFYQGSAGKVVVAGSFNDWSQDANPMSKDKNGIWSTVMPLGSGSHQYKFIVDGNWIKDPSNPNMVTDADGSENSALIVSGAAASKPLGAKPVSKSLTGNNIVRYDNPSAGDVWIAGDWNDWGGTAAGKILSKANCTPMTKDKEGVWTTNLSFLIGRHEYKFIIDGQWEEHDNRIVEIEKTKQAPKEGKPVKTASGLTVFEVEAPGAGKVDIYGSWNEWSSGTDMKRVGNKWRVEMELKPGRYEYKFMKDGDWDVLNRDDRVIEVK